MPDISNPAASKLEDREHSFKGPSSIVYQIDYDQAATLALKEIPGLQIWNIVPNHKLYAFTFCLFGLIEKALNTQKE